MTDGKYTDGGKLGKRPLTGAALLAKLMPAEVTLRFVHISDTHISHDPGYSLPEASHTPVEGARALVDVINNNLPFTPDFVLHTGDVTYDPDPLAYVTARDVLSQIRFPTYYLNGNHDDRDLLQRIMLDREPLTPFDYQFEAKGVQIVVVDSNGPAQQPAGFVTDDQLARLEGICKDTDDQRPLVIAVHHNVLPTGIPWWDDFMRMTNGEDFHQALLPARHRLRGVFHGHVHQPVDTYRDGILYSGVVSSWYQLHAWPGQSDTLGDSNFEPGFNVVTVTPNQTFIRRHAFQVQPVGETAGLRAKE